MTNNKKRLPQEGIDAVLNLLEDMYPEARCALNYRTPFQLLVATMLSLVYR